MVVHFFPALDVHKIGEQSRSSDLDVVAAVDGVVYLLEVKRSFAGVNAGELQKLVELAKILRPDYAGFCVARPQAESTLSKQEIAEATDALSAVDVRFVLWTPDNKGPWQVPSDIPVECGRTMDWSGW